MSEQRHGIKDVKKRHMRRRRKKRIRALLLTLSAFLICLVLFIGIRAAISLISKISQPKQQAKETSGETVPAPSSDTDTSKVEVQRLVINTNSSGNTTTATNDPKTITISSIGDCTLGTDANFDRSTSLNAYYDKYGADYFFQNVRTILEADDLSIVNMEGTLTEETSRADKTFAFKGPPEYASILSGSSVEAANLANNHSKDYGSKSLTDTIEHLTNAGIGTFGYDEVLILEVKGVKIGLTGIYELAEHLGKKQQVKDNIAALKEAGAQIIIVNFHWGIEREHMPDSTQKTLAHLAIDEGADLVIGHHPHVLQGVEQYNGKYIAYSLGNFCFGGNKNPSDKDTMIFQQTFNIDADGNLTDETSINMIPCSLSSVSNKNDYCPTPLKGEEAQRVLDKIEKYSEGL